MKKRRIRKARVALLFLFLVLLTIVCSILILKKDKNESIPPKEKEPEEVIELPKEKRMSLVAVGDALIHGAVYMDAHTTGNNYDFSSMFTYIEPIIKDYDLKYYNQETIIGGKNLGISHYPQFNSPDEIGLDLVKIGFNMVSLATNHSMDKREAGILYSVDFWRNTGIIMSGQSDSFEDRDNIRVHEQNGIKFAFISYTYGTNGITLPQGKEYLVNLYSDEQAKKDIDSIKDEVDVIIIAMHWGEEYTHVPTKEQRREAEYLSNLGVNLIIGAHPHVIQPVEYVGDTLVIYSLGNFISAQHPLGLAKTIGLLVGMDIVVSNEGKVTFENLDYKLLYTYCTSNYKNFKVIPFEELTDEILNNHDKIEAEYMAIVKGDN